MARQYVSVSGDVSVCRSSLSRQTNECSKTCIEFAEKFSMGRGSTREVAVAPPMTQRLQQSREEVF